MNVPFYKPQKERLTQALLAAQIALHAGHGSHGPEVQQLEEDLAEYWQVEPELVVCTDSCTSAMAIAHDVVGSCRVAVPSITWVATANAAALAGCEVVIGEVNPDNLIMDMAAEKLADCDTLVPVELYGQALDEAEFVTGRVIVDAAHAFEHGPVPKAMATCFSFHTLKSLGIGVGGCAVFDTTHRAATARMVRFHGIDQSRRQWQNGWKATMPAFAAAMGRELLKSVDQDHELRKQVAGEYREHIRHELQFDLHEPYNGWHAFPVSVLAAPSFQAELTREGIETAKYYPSLTSHPRWKEHGPVDEEIGDALVALPLRANMTTAEVEHVIANVNAYARIA